MPQNKKMHAFVATPPTSFTYKMNTKLKEEGL
jgi:hypothetical protein